MSQIAQLFKTHPASQLSIQYLNNIFPAAAQLENQPVQQFIKNHLSFAKNQLPTDNSLFKQLHYSRYHKFSLPKLIKQSIKQSITVDALPVNTISSPNSILEINYSNTQWIGCHGHDIPPNWALYSPSIIVTPDLPSNTDKYYSLLMTDLDYPDSNSKSYKNFCHWFVANIPVSSNSPRIEVPGGSSPLLSSDSNYNTSTETKGASFIPLKPETEPVIPGETIFRYIPPHPALSNPRKVHRYIFTLLQSQDGSPIDTEKLKQNYKISTDDVESRFNLGPIYKFMNENNLNLSSFGFFTSIWNIHTPEIFSRLNIHEPVYGTSKLNSATTSKSLIDTLETAKFLAKRLEKPLASANNSDLVYLNKGEKPQIPKLKLITKDEMSTIEKKKLDGNKVKKIKNEEYKIGKLPRLTVIGAAGVVKAKETDVAKSHVGDISKEVRSYRNPYLNI